ncbi:MAG: methyltransferase [Bacillota bacterium]
MLPLIIATGTAGIFLFLIWEIARWKEARKIAALFLQAFSFLFCLFAHFLVLTGPRYPGNRIAIIIGILLLIISTYLLYRSLWADLPRGTYVYAANSSLKVSRKGTYALVRHPGLWCYSLFLLGFYLVSASVWLIRAGIIWWLADFVVILIEDLYLYPRIFEDYPVYKKEVPMLIPRLNHFGCILMAPSRRMVIPFSKGFSTI